ncbi:DNA polymerase III subunit delta' [Chromatocurvus halotolerans]|uniref:DNA-directed DNA polymerase n=1 Tax=Chromatocurvus halotolerans TaxID=1132028 RepID=A0A4R2KHW4_9GAMM|nr:DNA polymerase III subunit delta' [Chromatocurvus halotolerans]TCO72754.1 DNA polymerase-3 subunit delta' [Chromatocurvus halotolerans]
MTPADTSGHDAISTPLPWQRDAWEGLTALAENDRLPHALLVSGEEGTGRRRFVTALSRYLLCQAPVQGSNCGQCKTCLLSQGNGHSDWRWVGPAGKARGVGIDQIRDVIRFSAQTSALGRYKILVIHPADGMTLAAANAFLKCLEEPAENTLILLITRSPAGVPATIRSRCQHVRLPAPAYEPALTWLAMLSGDRQLAKSALAAADGIPLQADLLLRVDGALDQAEAQEQMFSRLFDGEGEPTDVATMLSGMDPGAAVSGLLVRLHRHLRELPCDELRGQRAHALFALDSRLRDLQRAIAGGATPQKELLGAALASELAGILGSGPSRC